MFYVTLQKKTKMKNLGQYIKKLLPENDSVIIPGFGALVSKYKPAEINSETGEMIPPAKEIFFNQQIRYDDGLLVACIAESESLSRYDALKVVEKERENIIYRLDKGEKVLLEEVGEFSLNENNEIQFEPRFTQNMLIDSFGLEPVNIPDIPEENTKTEPAPAPEPVYEPIITSTPKTKKKRRGLWLLLLLILIAIIVFFMFSNYTLFMRNRINDFVTNIFIVLSDNKNKVNNQENIHISEILEDNTTATTIIDSTQVLANDTTNSSAIVSAEIEINENEITEQTALTINDSPGFYLVGGSFIYEENVKKFIEQFNVEGYEAFYIGKRGRFHLVGLGKYNTLQEAHRAVNNYVRKRPDSGAWIYEKK